MGRDIRVRNLVVLVATPLMAMTASADEGQGFKLAAEENVRHESNLFRLSSGASVPATIGRSSAAETIYTTSLGFRYDKSYSLQHVNLDVSYVDYHFQNFDYLSFDALNYRATWRWSLTPHFYGNISAVREQTLNNFGDFIVPSLSRQRNERVESNQRADGLYELDSRWLALGAVAKYSQENSIPLITETASTATATEGGLRYLLPSGSFATVTLRKTDGSYTDAVAGASGANNGFNQKEQELDALWKTSSKTSVGIKLGHRQRSHAGTPERDFSGVFGTAKFDWSLTSRLALTSGWIRDISAFQSVDTNYSTSDRIFINPTWQILAKTKASLQYTYTRRQFGGSPNPALSSQRRDTDSDVILGLDWQPREYMNIISTLQHTERSSTLTGRDFKNTSMGVSAKLKF